MSASGGEGAGCGVGGMGQVSLLTQLMAKNSNFLQSPIYLQNCLSEVKYWHDRQSVAQEGTMGFVYKVIIVK